MPNTSKIYFKKNTWFREYSIFALRLCENVTFRSNCRDDNFVGRFSNLEKRMLLFISTFCKINFGSINLITELGQQATLLMVEREIRKHRLRALWILQNNVIKGENLWVRNLFSFYNFQCPSEGINSELTINIVLGRNHLTKYVCCSTWPARTHVIPQN